VLTQNSQDYYNQQQELLNQKGLGGVKIDVDKDAKGKQLQTDLQDQLGVSGC
jgi:hypothetical protein